MTARRTWLGRFIVGRFDHGRASYHLVGALDAPRDGRQVELHIERDRFQSLVINLTAESRLFPVDDDATQTDRVNRLRMLAQLGMPGEQARALVYPDRVTAATGDTDHETYRARDAEIRVFPQNRDTDDASDMYVMDVLGVSVLVRQRTDGTTYIHVDNEESGSALTVEVNNSGENEYT